MDEHICPKMSAHHIQASDAKLKVNETLIEELLNDCKSPANLLGENGFNKQLQMLLLRRPWKLK